MSDGTLQITEERVSADHMAVYRSMVEQIKQAELSASILRQSLMAMLGQFYSLKQGDQVLETGEIIRINSAIASTGN